MNLIKNIFIQKTGYWIHKLNNLPVGADLFVDIQCKIKFPSINVVFDVGANVGQSRSYFRFYLPDAKIFSFEPVESSFTQLKNSAAADNNCVLENMALGDVAGQKIIRLFDRDVSVLNSLRDDVMNRAENAKMETISVDTLDRYCSMNYIQKIDLLKIDTEGFEINVLKGAEKMLQDGRICFVYCEVGFQKMNKRNTYFAELSEILEKYGYYFFGMYQMDYHDWHRGNHLGNALYVHKNIFPQQV
jgi:FkbM family methyltransferase